MRFNSDMYYYNKLTRVNILLFTLVLICIVIGILCGWGKFLIWLTIIMALVSFIPSLTNYNHGKYYIEIDKELIYGYSVILKKRLYKKVSDIDKIIYLNILNTPTTI